MVTMMLNHEELDVLRKSLKEQVLLLRSEISRTESLSLRESLKEEEEVLVRVLGQLEKVSHPSAAPGPV